MNFTCNNCQKRYSIADEKVRGKTVKVRCKNCQNVISVEGPQLPLEESTRVVSLADVERLRAQERSLVEPDSVPPAASVPAPVVSAPPVTRAPAAALQTPWDDEPTRAAPLRALASPWFVMVRNKQEGPLDEGGLRELLASGAVSGRSFFWQQGMADWKRGSDIPELAGLFAPPPAPEPPPPPPPPPEEEPAPAPAPARSARGAAAARREPEPQPFMPEPEPPPEEPQPQQQAWEPEPQQQAWASGQQEEEEQPENTYYHEPAARTPASGRRQAPAPAASAAPLNDDQLFSDLDLPGNRDGGDEGGDYDRGALPPEDDDRLAARGGGDDGESDPVEAPPRRAAKKPGMKRRTPAWKYALLALLLLLVLPVGGAYVMSDVLGVMPLRVKTQDAQGNPVERSFFSAEGAGALRDKLLGRTPPAPKPVPATPKPTPAPEKQPEPTQPPAGGAGAAPTGAPPAGAGTESGAAAAPAAEQQQAANADPAKKDVAGQEAKAAAPLADDLSDEEVDRVVEQAQVAFRECADAEFRKNPSFRGGKVKLTATVGNTGTVKEAVLSRKDLRSSPVGTCIVDKAKAMVFSAFKGDDVELEIPLVLSRT